MGNTAQVKPLGSRGGGGRGGVVRVLGPRGGGGGVGRVLRVLGLRGGRGGVLRVLGSRGGGRGGCSGYWG